MWRDSRETARVKYAHFDPNALIQDARVSVEAREVERYYREHKDQFERPAHARIRYAVIDRTPTAADTAAALAKAQQVRAEIAGGAKFEDVAKRESADSVSGREGGALGKITKGRMVPAFETAVFALPVNQLSQPVPRSRFCRASARSRMARIGCSRRRWSTKSATCSRRRPRSTSLRCWKKPSRAR
jgi:peptidyl-prolyl cis-trans isomerase D